MNDVIIPGTLKGGPSKVFLEEVRKGEEFEELAQGIGTGYSIIGITQSKEFYLHHRGVRRTIVNPSTGEEDGGDPVKYLDVIILRKNALPSHTWYEKGYQPGSKDPPECVSTDGIAPDDGCKKPQAQFCQICQHHEWKEQPSGRRGRACADSMRLAILPLPHQMRPVLDGDVLKEPCLLRVPAASMKGLVSLGDALERRLGLQKGEAPLCSFVCRIAFDPDKRHPQFTYEVKDWLSDGQAVSIMELRKHPTAFRVLGLSPEGRSIVRAAANDANVLQQQIALTPPGRPQVVSVTPGKPFLELQPEKIEAVAKPQPTPPPKPKLVPVPETEEEIDALVEAMRPRPPGS
jgi:hypothetical protein